MNSSNPTCSIEGVIYPYHCVCLRSTWTLMLVVRQALRFRRMRLVKFVKGFSCPTTDTYLVGTCPAAHQKLECQSRAPLNNCQRIGALSEEFWRQASVWSYKTPSTLPPFCLFFFLSSSYLPCFEYPSSRYGVFSWEGLHCTSRSRSLLHCPSGPWEAQFLIYPLRFHCDVCYMQAHEEDDFSRGYGDAVVKHVVRTRRCAKLLSDACRNCTPCVVLRHQDITQTLNMRPAKVMNIALLPKAAYACFAWSFSLMRKSSRTKSIPFNKIIASAIQRVCMPFLCHSATKTPNKETECQIFSAWRGGKLRQFSQEYQPMILTQQFPNVQSACTHHRNTSSASSLL